MSKNITYPALRMSMGSWTYFSVRMTMKEAAGRIILATNFKEATALDDMLQRIWDDNRSKGAMTNYLKVRDDRFYGSLIVAPIGKSPKFTGIKADEEIAKKHNISEDANDSIGFVTLDKDTDYYVLDGQHRLGSIKHVIDEDELGPAFGDEEINVIFVVDESDNEKDRNIKYRRLFTSLNRYAKPTDQTTNIIMEEDDAYAILTRKLVEEHKVFGMGTGDEAARSNTRVNVRTKNLNETSPHFTSLATLYGMTKKMLAIPEFPDINPAGPLGLLQRPTEEQLDVWYSELSLLWDVIGESFPLIFTDLTKLRAKNSKNDKEFPLAYLYPRIQENLWIPIIRKFIMENAEFGDKDQYLEAIEPLTKINWDLRSTPWNPLILGKNDPTDPDAELIILDDEKASRDRVMKDVIYHLTNFYEFNEEDLLNLKGNLFSLATQLEDEDAREKWWKELLSLKI
jgi:DGQHR domain-containing protein